MRSRSAAILIPLFSILFLVALRIIHWKASESGYESGKNIQNSREFSRKILQSDSLIKNMPDSMNINSIIDAIMHDTTSTKP